MNKNKSAADQNTVAFFDTVSENYYDLYNDRSPGGYAFVLRRQRVLELFDKPGGKVLDVGCGSGIMVEALLERGCSFWGVDPAPGMIEDATKRFGDVPNVHLAVGSAESLAFPDNYFDAVLCMGVVERVKDDRLALAEMIRVLKKDGTLVVTMPNKYSPYFLWRDNVFYPAVSVIRPVYLKLRGRNKSPVIPGHRLYSASSYETLMNELGCRVTEVAYMGYNFLLSPLDDLFPQIAVSTMKQGENLRGSRIRHLAGGLIVKAKKL